MGELLLQGMFNALDWQENDNVNYSNLGFVMAALHTFRKLTSGDSLHPETAKFMAMGFEGVCNSLEALEGTEAYAVSLGITDVSGFTPSLTSDSIGAMDHFECAESSSAISGISSRAGIDDGGGDFGGAFELPQGHC